MSRCDQVTAQVEEVRDDVVEVGSDTRRGDWRRPTPAHDREPLLAGEGLSARSRLALG
jgi:hypothetical protein